TASSNPKVSTKMCRLTPLIFFSRVVAPLPAGSGRLDGLAIDATGAGLRRLASRLPHPSAQRVMDPLPESGATPLMEVIPDRAFGGKVVRQGGPGTTSSQDVFDRIDDLTEVRLSRRAHREGRGQHRLQDGPFGIAEIAGIGLARRGV